MEVHGFYLDGPKKAAVSVDRHIVTHRMAWEDLGDRVAGIRLLGETVSDHVRQSDVQPLIAYVQEKRHDGADYPDSRVPPPREIRRYGDGEKRQGGEAYGHIRYGDSLVERDSNFACPWYQSHRCPSSGTVFPPMPGKDHVFPLPKKKNGRRLSALAAIFRHRFLPFMLLLSELSFLITEFGLARFFSLCGD